MAEDKKSFILYADLIHTVRKMPKDKQGELFMTILAYVNDENPVVDDVLVDIAFEPIKRQLKRDLARWDAFKKKQAINGKKGGRPINPKNPSLLDESQKSLTVTVNDTVTVSELVAPTHTQVKELFFQSRKSGWSDGRCTVEATNFFDHYESTGWRVNGHPLKNWQARARKWINDERRSDTQPATGISLPSSPRR